METWNGPAFERTVSALPEGSEFLGRRLSMIAPAYTLSPSKAEEEAAHAGA